MTHKEAAAEFLTMAGMGDVRAAFDKFAAPDFIHHNQYFKGDRQSLIDAMESAAETSPNKSIDIKHIYEDGDTVITHSQVTRSHPAGPDIAVVHIFRFEGDQVAELWDVIQFIDEGSPNENGHF